MSAYINLKKYGTKIKDLKNIRNKIRENLGENIFLIKDFQNLQFEALRQITSVRSTVKNDAESIAISIKKVMNHFHIPKATIRELNNIGEFEEKKPKKEENETDLFNFWFLGFDSTPYKEYQYLKASVEKHLKYITVLIKKYESEVYIKNYLKEAKTPSNTYQRMLLDFYKRCTNERDIILNYYLNGLKERAIQKANTKLGLNIGLWNTYFYDFPYQCWQIYSDQLFDYTKINCASHRCSDLPANEKMEDIYTNNKDLFYRKFFRQKPVQQIFTNIRFYYEHIPKVNNRQPIIDELERLFKGRRWLAFYALAIPQVEGLFTEMLNTINPDEKGKSLSEKVEKVRPSYKLSASYFDYYQYIVPELRNKFAHSGYESDLKLKSFDLLTDIEFILETFYELDNPQVKIKRLIKQSNPLDFSGYREISTFFEFVNNLHHSQRKILQNELTIFIDDFLIPNCTIDYIFTEVLSTTKTIINELIHYIEKHFNSTSIADDFNTRNLIEIREIINKNEESFTDIARYKMELFEELFYLKSFYDLIKKYFKNYSINDKEEFILEMKTKIPTINNLLLIKELESNS